MLGSCLVETKNVWLELVLGRWMSRRHERTIKPNRKYGTLPRNALTRAERISNGHHITLDAMSSVLGTRYVKHYCLIRKIPVGIFKLPIVSSETVRPGVFFNDPGLLSW